MSLVGFLKKAFNLLVRRKIIYLDFAFFRLFHFHLNHHHLQKFVQWSLEVAWISSLFLFILTKWIIIINCKSLCSVRWRLHKISLLLFCRCCIDSSCLFRDFTGLPRDIIITIIIIIILILPLVFIIIISIITTSST